MSQPSGFDLAVARSRRAGSDRPAFMPALAERLEMAGAADDARTAVGAGRDDLARAALVHKQDALHERHVLNDALSATAPQMDKLVGCQQRLQARIEQFRTGKGAMKASYAAARAQVKVTQSLSGIGQGMSGVGDTLRRADAKVRGMRDKADAMDGLIRTGVLEDPLDGRSPRQRELAAICATNAMDDELAQLQADTHKAIQGPESWPEAQRRVMRESRG